jgi:hypothetical protein
MWGVKDLSGCNWLKRVFYKKSLLLAIPAINL